MTKLKTEVEIPIRIKLESNATCPKYATTGSAGADLTAAIDRALTISSGETEAIPTGIFMEIPSGYEVQIRPRSGLAFKHGVTVLNTPGTIDSDYRGEIKVILINHGKEAFEVTPSMRIAQMLVAKAEKAFFIEEEALTETPRGSGGFGHSGTH